MCIVEIHEMDAISIKKAITKDESKWRPRWAPAKTQFCFWGGFVRCRFKIFPNFSYKEQLTVFFYKFLILPGYRLKLKAWSPRCFKITTVAYSGIPIAQTLSFSILPITWTKSRFPSSVKRCNFTPDFSNSDF